MTANVKTFENMFQGASSFNQDISGWSTGKATSFAFMFHKASSFNFDLSDWATSSLTTVESMFSLATSFNRALCWRLDNSVVKANAFHGCAGSVTDRSTCSPSSAPTPQPTMACTAGNIWDGATQTCTACIAGKYSSATYRSDLTACTICTSGKWSSQGSSSCTACTTGRYLSDGGTLAMFHDSADDCEVCAPGKYSSTTGAFTCTDCAAGFNMSSSGGTKCKACARGRHQSALGQMDCVACTAGSHSDKGASSCAECAAGTWSATNSANCTECVAGTISSAGAAVCAYCFKGTYASKAASSACVDCPAGRYVDKMGQSQCNLCPGGRFSGAAATTTCTSCPPGTRSEDGALSCDDCRTGRWSYASSSNCTRCDKGYFMHDMGSFEALPPAQQPCLMCASSGLICSSLGVRLSTIQLEDGYFRIAAHSHEDTEIRACPAKHACQGGSNFSTLGESYCREGYVGPMCEVCKEKFFRDSTLNECMVCSRTTASTGLKAALAGFAFVIVVGSCLVIRKVRAMDRAAQEKWEEEQRKHPGRSRRKAPSGIISPLFHNLGNMLPKMQNKTDTGDPEGNENALDDQEAAKRTKDATNQAREIFDKVKTKVKIMVTFAQLVTTLQTNIGVPFPVKFTACLGVLKLANLDFFKMVPLECLVPTSYYHRLLTMTLTPLFVAMWLLALDAKHGSGECRAVFCSCFNGKAKAHGTGDGDAAHPQNGGSEEEAAGETAYSIQKALADHRARLQIFRVNDRVEHETRGAGRVTSIDEDGGKTFIKYDREESGEHGYDHISLSTGKIRLLEEEEEAHHNQGAGNHKGKTQAYFTSFLVGAYLVLPPCSTIILQFFRCDYFADVDTWYMVADYQIKCQERSTWILYNCCMMLIYPLGIPCLFAVMLWSARRELCPKGFVQATDDRRFGRRTRRDDEKPLGLWYILARNHHWEYPENEESYAKGHQLAFLASAYQPHAFMFEVIECARRLMLSSMLIVIPDNRSASQEILAVFICLFSIKIYSYYQPFVQDRDDMLSEFAQWQLFFVLFAALMIRVNEDESSDNETQGYLLIACTSTGFILMQILIFYDIREDVQGLRQLNILSMLRKYYRAFCQMCYAFCCACCACCTRKRPETNVDDAVDDEDLTIGENPMFEGVVLPPDSLIPEEVDEYVPPSAAEVRNLKEDLLTARREAAKLAQLLESELFELELVKSLFGTDEQSWADPAKDWYEKTVKVAKPDELEGAAAAQKETAEASEVQQAAAGWDEDQEDVKTRVYLKLKAKLADLEERNVELQKEITDHTDRERELELQIFGQSLELEQALANVEETRAAKKNVDLEYEQVLEDMEKKKAQREEEEEEERQKVEAKRQRDEEAAAAAAAQEALEKARKDEDANSDLSSLWSYKEDPEVGHEDPEGGQDGEEEAGQPAPAAEAPAIEESVAAPNRESEPEPKLESEAEPEPEVASDQEVEDAALEDPAPSDEEPEESAADAPTEKAVAEEEEEEEEEEEDPATEEGGDEDEDEDEDEDGDDSEGEQTVIEF